MRAGDFSAITTQLRDPIRRRSVPGNQIPVSRFDPASLNVLKYMPNVAGGNGANVQVPRRIGRNDNQIIFKIDSQLTQNNQVSVRYFFDHFTNDPTFNEGNLLSYRNPTLGSRQRIQNVVGTWQRTLTSTLLNEFRVGYNKFASSRYPPSGVPSMQDLGVRLPIYPTLRRSRRSRPSGSSTSATTCSRRSRGSGIRNQRPHQLGKRHAPDPVRRRDGVPGREDPQRVPPRRALPVPVEQHAGHRPRAGGLHARPDQTRSIRELASTRTTTCSMRRRSSRMTIRCPTG